MILGGGRTYNEHKVGILLSEEILIGQAKVDFGTRCGGGVHRQQEQLGRPEEERERQGVGTSRNHN